MKGLLEVLPQPKWVKIGENKFLVGQFRLCDLAVLQAYLEEVRPHPLEAARDELKTIEGKERRKRLASLQREARSWAPSILQDASFFLGSIESLAVWLSLILIRFNDLKGIDLTALAENLTLEEYQVLDRIAYGVTSASELNRLCFPDRYVGGSRPEPDWREMVDHLSTLKSWTYDEIGNLTLSQFRAAISGGKEVNSNDVTGMSHAQLCEMIRRQREEAGLDEEPKEGE